MMKYLCLIYGCGDDGDPAVGTWGPAGAPAEFRRPWQPVGSAVEAVTIRVRDDDLLVLEGSFAGNGGRLPGFLIVDALDLNDAIRIVSAHPAVARGLTAELRPVSGWVAGR